MQPWTAFGPLWLTWWLGDAAGDLLIVPALLTWHAWRDAPRRRIGELALLLVGLAVTCAGVFAGPFRDAAAAHYSLEYIVFPFLIWAAIRFGTAGAAAANIVTASIAIWGTVHGFGPYAVGDVAGHLLFLQLFLAVVATTGLLLGATISERTAALRRRNAEHAVTRVLADAASGEEAIQRIIDVINTDLDWDIGLWWSVDPERATAALRRDPVPGVPPAFRGSSTSAGTRIFEPGEWLPGHVWAYAAPQWIPDVLKEHDVPRLQAAAAEGLHGAFAFPISVGHEVLGVFEFCSRSVRRPDDDLLWMFTAIGAEVGQFLSRKRMEHQIQESEARKAGMLNAALDCIITVDQHGSRRRVQPRGGAHVRLSLGRDRRTARGRRARAGSRARALPRAAGTLPDVRRARASPAGASRWSGCGPTARDSPPSSRSRRSRRPLVRCSPGSFATSPGKSGGRTSSPSAPRTTA